MRSSLAALFALACVASGCSFLVQFDPETQPCDSTGACLAGYACVDGLCKSLDGGAVPTDAGTDAGTCAARETVCGDGNDDDCDGKTDCADSDCAAQACDDGDACTVGETCNTLGVCQRGTAKDCSTPAACQAARGTCEAGTGRCVYAALADGTSCGSIAAARCCGGQCINTTSSLTNCGGCGLACGTGQLCESINQSTCNVEPVDTSGRCTCATGVPCPMGQSCASGRCVPVLASHCAQGETIATAGGTCQPYCRY